MWYVVQTVGGQEKHVLDLINKLVDEELIQESFIPQYEVKKRIQGVWKMRSEVLLPGYIFVITDQPGKLREALRSVPKFTRLLATTMCSLLSTIKKSPSSTRSPSLTTAWSSSRAA